MCRSRSHQLLSPTPRAPKAANAHKVLVLVLVLVLYEGKFPSGKSNEALIDAFRGRPLNTSQQPNNGNPCSYSASGARIRMV